MSGAMFHVDSLFARPEKSRAVAVGLLVLALAGCDMQSAVSVRTGSECVRVTVGDEVHEFPLKRLDLDEEYAAGRRVFVHEYLLARGELRFDGITIYGSDVFAVKPFLFEGTSGSLIAESTISGPQTDIRCMWL